MASIALLSAPVSILVSIQPKCLLPTHPPSLDPYYSAKWSFHIGQIPFSGLNRHTTAAWVLMVCPLNNLNTQTNLTLKADLRGRDTWHTIVTLFEVTPAFSVRGSANLQKLSLKSLTPTNVCTRLNSNKNTKARYALPIFACWIHAWSQPTSKTDLRNKWPIVINLNINYRPTHKLTNKLLQKIWST